MTRAEELAETIAAGLWGDEAEANRGAAALRELVADAEGTEKWRRAWIAKASQAEALAEALEREKRAADIESEHLTLQLHAANAKAEALAGALEATYREIEKHGYVIKGVRGQARKALARHRGEKDDPHGVRRPGEYNHFGGDCI